jgi:hypothetical protein
LGIGTSFPRSTAPRKRCQPNPRQTHQADEYLDNGGGIANDGGTLSVANSTIAGNWNAGDGGGIYNQGGTVTIASSTDAGNTGYYGASGVSSDNAMVTISNSTFTNPGTPDRSGTNCNFPSGPVTSGGYNLDSDGTCGLNAATDQNNVDPQLGMLQANGGPTETMAPASTSPVVDAIPQGTNGCGTTLTADQRGVSRPQGAGCDIGSVELNSSPPPPVEVPSTGFAFPASLNSTAVPAVEKWATASDPNGICSYDLRESVAGGPYNEVTLPSQTSTSVGLSLSPATSYGFELNVTNCVGQSSGWGVQPSFVPLAWQESSTRLTYTGAWTAQSVPGAYGGSLKYTTASDASVAGAFFAEGIAWVSETGPTMGKATVYVDGVAVKTVNLYSASVHEAQIVWKEGWSTPQVKHSIKIVAKGTAGRPRVDLDALLTLNIP